MRGHSEIVSYFLEKQSADIYAMDKFGNTALHLACIYGYAATAEVILKFEQTQIRSLLCDAIPILDEKKQPFRQLIKEAYIEIQNMKLKPNERRIFRHHWMLDAATYIVNVKIPLSKRPLFPPIQKSIVESIVARYAYLLEEEMHGELTYFLKKRKDNGEHECVCLIPILSHFIFCIENIYYESFLNLKNKQGRTALHLAAEEDREGSHKSLICMLIETFGASLDCKDIAGKTFFDCPSINLMAPTLNVPQHSIVSKKGYIRDKEQAWECFLSTLYETNCCQEEYFMDIRAQCHTVREDDIWKEYRELTTGVCFYENNETGVMQYDIPSEWNEKRKRLIHDWKSNYEEDHILSYEVSTKAKLEDFVQCNIYTDAKTAFCGTLQRTFQGWEEYDDLIIGGTCYYNSASCIIRHEKPDEVVEYDKKHLAYLYLYRRSRKIAEYGETNYYKMYYPNSQSFFYWNHVNGDGAFETCRPESISTYLTKKREDNHARMVSKLDHIDEEEEELTRLLVANNRKQGNIEVKRIEDLNNEEFEKTDVEIIQLKLAERKIAIRNEYASSGEEYIQDRTNLEEECFHQTQSHWLLPAFYENTNAMEVKAELASPRDLRRRDFSAFLEHAINRLHQETLCFWGCGQWFYPEYKGIFLQHQQHHCTRILGLCRLGCAQIRTQEEWGKPYDDQYKTYIHYHEAVECSSRLEQCIQQCGKWISHMRMKAHCEIDCSRRQTPDLCCRLGCGKIYKGENSCLEELENDRLIHEEVHCPLRLITCDFEGCTTQMQAEDYPSHSHRHLVLMGVHTYAQPGEYQLQIPMNVKSIKVQAWGAGGGSGHLKHQKAGAGGGGAFIELIYTIRPKQKLTIYIGAGGDGGDYKSEVAGSGIGKGGYPGGGNGHSNNLQWACGGGGGSTMLYRDTPDGKELLVLAGAGGGGGSRDGQPASDNRKECLKREEELNGETGTIDMGGSGGTCFDGIETASSSGAAFTGGDGALFGGGGGSGYFGGGGGGCLPGIVGGGGGGSSFVKTTGNIGKIYIIPGNGRSPGTHGFLLDPPPDIGTGGLPSIDTTNPGHCGCIRIAFPGFFKYISSSENQETL